MHSTYVNGYIGKDGKLYTFGLNDYGQLGRPGALGGSTWVPGVVEGLPDMPVRSFDATHYSLLIVMANGDLYSAGYNYHGQCGVPTNWRSSAHRHVPELVMKNVQAVACGVYHVVVLMENGDVYTFGYNNHGEMGDGTSADRWQPTKVAEGARYIACGYHTTMYITYDGKLFTTGYNGNHNLMRAGSSNQRWFGEVTAYPDLVDLKSITQGTHQTLFIKQNDELWGCGYNYYGSLGVSWYYRSGSFKPPSKIMDNVKQAVCGYHHSGCVTKDGIGYCFGYNYHGEAGSGSNYFWEPRVVNPEGKLIDQMQMNYYSTTFLTKDGERHGAGYNYYSTLGVSSYAGSSSDKRFFNNEPSQDGLAMTLPLRPIDIILSILQANVESFHKDNTAYSMDTDHVEGLQLSYKINVNGKQVYPRVGWTSSLYPPFSINKSLTHDVFDVGDNVVTVLVKDSSGAIMGRSVNIEKTNEMPVANLGVPSMQIHTDKVKANIRITDAEGDFIRYKLSLNGDQIFPVKDGGGYTDLQPTPFENDIIIPNSKFNVGLNTILLETLDDLAGYASKTVNVVKTNTLPKVEGEVRGSYLDVEITDEDLDGVQYRIILNGTQIFPENDFTDYLPTPFKITQMLPHQNITLGGQNKVRVELNDILGGFTAWEYTFTGIRAGLMFTDADENFYTTEFGEVLKYLDFGTIIAGQTTLAERVWVKNTLGYPVGDLRLTVDQVELDGEHAKAEISALDTPFQGGFEVEYSDILQHNDKVSFYVRIVTDREAMWGGMFDVKAKANPK